MTGSTPVVNITFPRSEPSEDPGYCEAREVYDDLVKSLVGLLDSRNCSVSSSTAAALDILDFSRFPVLLKGSRYLLPWFRPLGHRENDCLQDVCCLLNLSAF